MRINEVERRVGITKKNIRFYEDEGLLKPGRSAENGYRDYTEADVEALVRIKLLRQLSVPLEDIRRLQTGELTLTACMHAQQAALERRARDLEQISGVCADLAQSGTELERTGTRFMNVKNDRRKKLLGPTAITVGLCIVLLAAEVLLVQAIRTEAPPLLVSILLLGAPPAVAGGLIAALWLRVKEVKGGEEDEAAQY